MTKNEEKYYFEKLKDHVGHSIDIVSYAPSSYLTPNGHKDHIENISVECLTCNEVLIDFEDRFNQ